MVDVFDPCSLFLSLRSLSSHPQSSLVLDIPVKAVGAYVNARVRHNGVPDKSTKQRTRVLKNTSDPVWNEELNLRIRNINTDSISFHIYDKGAVQANVLIGACSVSLIDEFPPPYDTQCVYKGLPSAFNP